MKLLLVLLTIAVFVAADISELVNSEDNVINYGYIYNKPEEILELPIPSYLPPKPETIYLSPHATTITTIKTPNPEIPTPDYLPPATATTTTTVIEPAPQLEYLPPAAKDSEYVLSSINIPVSSHDIPLKAKTT